MEVAEPLALDPDAALGDHTRRARARQNLDRVSTTRQEGGQEPPDTPWAQHRYAQSLGRHFEPLFPLRRLASCAGSHRRLRFLIHHQPKHVRPGLVPGNVEVEFAASYLVEVEIREQGFLAVPGGASQDIAERPDDAATAGAQDAVGARR